MHRDHLPTDLDTAIRLSLRINQRARPWLGTLLADEQDAHIMRRLLRVRRDNQRARANPELPGELS